MLPPAGSTDERVLMVPGEMSADEPPLLVRIGGFLAAQARSKPVSESLLWAHAASARSTLASGAREALPDGDEVEYFMRGTDPKFNKHNESEACGCKGK